MLAMQVSGGEGGMGVAHGIYARYGGERRGDDSEWVCCVGVVRACVPCVPSVRASLRLSARFVVGTGGFSLLEHWVLYPSVTVVGMGGHALRAVRGRHGRVCRAAQHTTIGVGGYAVRRSIPPPPTTVGVGGYAVRSCFTSWCKSFAP